MTYLLARSRRAVEFWRRTGDTYQRLGIDDDGAVRPIGVPCGPLSFNAHRNVTSAYGGATWHEVDEAEGRRALGVAS